MTVIYQEITPKYDQEICNIIREVGKEFGAVGEGFGPGDEEVLNMSHYYCDEKISLYLIAINNGEVVGGCGIAPFNSEQMVCELKKLFILPQARGLGIGKALTIKCLEYAKSKGFKKCYLDTLSNMQSAISLYENLGFTHLAQPIDGTIHNKCDVWMLKEL
ncbi:GNAT family N-acetyltransferase [Vibrio marisflavi]|uniref:N-acetyltransferase domain-containing protein n=1 Tax=Vibrio marisflavi CECT 7928 TaxID=634439 RepID=A0ABM9A567_9VIBR|nr:GNAT family N-acetyltransferase [Vibrio marisflavi]CAH0540137.1 hypothetical protein VMF7928_02636 [Vibrio marisflavi CECT 7928]